MPVIKVWCLPHHPEQEPLERLHKSIVEAVISVKDFNLASEEDMTCLFPPDSMSYGLGSSIVVEISGLPDRGETARHALAEKVGKAVYYLYLNAKVECIIHTANPADGYWKSSK